MIPAKSDRKIVRAWTMYDWANSVYPLVINSTIFPIYYESITTVREGGVVVSEMVNFAGVELRNAALYSYALSFSYLVTALLIPVLSGIADYTGTKKTFLKIFCYLGSAACLLFSTFSASMLEWGMLLVIMASIGFSGGLVFYNAFLPEIAPPEEQDQVSARGFTMGYLGSVLLLVVNLAMVMFPGVLGIDSQGTAIKISFIMVGLWWAGFAQFTFRNLPEQPTGKKVHHDLVKKGYRELLSVWRDLKHNPLLKRYLSAFFVFNMGVQTVMILAATFAAKEVREIGPGGIEQPMSSEKLIISILIIQLLAIPGAWFFSWFSSRRGNLHALFLALAVWIGVCAFAFFVYYDYQFFMIAAVVGLIMGGIQSLSRSTYSKLLPDTIDHASYFSFYDVADKIGIVIGTFAYGYIFQLTGSMRNSIVAIAVFFVTGLVLLLRMPRTRLLVTSD